MGTVRFGEFEAERCARALLLQLLSGLQTNVNAVFAEHEVEDRELAAALQDRQYADIPTLRLAPTNFEFGHNPETVERPRDEFPRICVMGHTWRAASGGEDGDMVDAYEVDIYVELILAEERPFVLNPQTQRLAQAVQRTVKDDTSLGGLVDRLRRPPTGSASNVDPTSRDAAGRSGNWFLQGARLDYTFVTYDPHGG